MPGRKRPPRRPASPSPMGCAWGRGAPAPPGLGPPTLAATRPRRTSEGTFASYRAHGRAVLAAAERPRDIPRGIQRRYPDTGKLYRRRKNRDRARRNTCLVTEGVRRIDAHMVHVPGVGHVPVREALADDVVLRSCTIVERTTPDRARRCGRHMKGRNRAFALHVQVRVPQGTGEGLERLEAVGIDHGVVHPMTTRDSQGNTHHYHHRDAELGKLDRRVKKVQRSLRNCRPKSREWRKRQRLVKSLRGRAAAIRSHTRREWAVELAKGYETVCCERMDATRLKRSARGTHEKHGKLVGVQREFSRRLANVAPGEQRAELKAACERHGAKYVETPARGSSEFCPVCHHCASENRKSQARFRCTKCGHADNADANAAQEPPPVPHVGETPGRGQAVLGGNSKAQADGDNPATAPKANRGPAPGRRRNPKPGPTPSPERGPPPGSSPGTKAGAPEAAANDESPARAIY